MLYCAGRNILIAQKTALDQNRGRSDIFHQIDRRIDALFRFLIFQVDRLVEQALHGVRKRCASLFYSIEYLRTVRPFRRRKAVLVNTDKDSTLRAVNERDAVFKVGTLLFPQRGGTF